MRWVSRVAVVVGVLGVLAGAASAQPGRSYPQPPPPAPGPSTRPAPCGYAPGCARRPVYQLTRHEQELLERGEYSEGEIIAGGLVGSFFGLGMGHAIEGRWSDRGWIFTFGEAGAMGLMISNMADCIDGPSSCNEGWLAMSALAFGVLRIWEIVDVWAGPARHNSELRALRWRLGMHPQPRWGLRLAPAKQGSGATVGLTYRF